MGLLNLHEQIGFYRRYHSNPVNVAIHMVFVPTIHLTSTILLSRLGLGTITEQYPYVNVGTLTAVAYGVYYAALDWKFGIPAAAGVIAMSIFATDIATEHGQEGLKVAGAVWVASWLAQFAGHRFAEHKAPALFDNLVQALVLAPFFVMFEVAHLLGIRTSVLNNVDAEIAAEKKK